MSTLLISHHDDVRRFARKRRHSIFRALKGIGAVLGLLHRGIVSAKVRRAKREFFFRNDYDEMPPPEDNVTKFPQRPLIIGDKWDF